MMRLKRWNIVNDTVCGLLFGSSRYPNGTKIRTSQVVAAAYDGEILLVKTQNSVYECYEKDYIGSEEQLLIFIRAMVEDKDGTHAL